jgi:endonuclease/exonuclease/phosphatase family metal-dependent hydrolase
MTAGTSRDRRTWLSHPAGTGWPDIATLLLAAATTAILLQATRVFLSYMLFLIDQSQRVQLGTIAGGVFLAIAFGAVLPRLLGIRGAMVTTTAGMVTARVALQVWSLPEARMWLGAATIVLAGWLLPALLTRARAAAASGIGLGLALDLGVRVSRDSVDLPFIPTVGADVATAVLGLLAGLAAIVLWTDRQPLAPSGLAVTAFALGPALTLHHLAIGNLGAVQVQLGVGMGAAAWLLAVGILLGLAIDVLVIAGESPNRNRPGTGRIMLPLLIAVGALGLWVFWQDLADVGAAGIVVGTAASIALIVTVLRGGRGAGGVTGTALWLTVGMLVQAVVLFVYFSATGLPLLIAVAYGLLALIGLVLAWGRPLPRAPSRTAYTGLGAVAAALIAVTLVSTVSDDAPEATEPLPGEFTAMTYNIQAGFSRDTYWDLEAIAAVIEAADPDVVLLQEVGRGWPLMAGVDQARWLSQRLEMQLVWGPASRDDLWGNAILTRAPILSTEHIKYDTTENLRRGAVRAVLESEAGPVAVISTHLDNPGDAASARQAQITQLLAFWDGADPAVISGDFNADPDSDAMATLAAAGFIDSGAILGVAGTTSSSGRRIDYVLITPGITVIDAVVPDVWASDHRPLVARLQVTV